MRDHSRRLLLSTVLGLGAITSASFVPAASFAATSATTTTTTATCGEARWPASVQGQPLTLKAGARAGDYLWHNTTGWHIRVTHRATARVVFRREDRLERPTVGDALQARSRGHVRAQR